MSAKATTCLCLCMGHAWTSDLTVRSRTSTENANTRVNITEGKNLFVNVTIMVGEDRRKSNLLVGFYGCAKNERKNRSIFDISLLTETSSSTLPSTNCQTIKETGQKSTFNKTDVISNLLITNCTIWQTLIFFTKTLDISYSGVGLWYLNSSFSVSLPNVRYFNTLLNVEPN